MDARTILVHFDDVLPAHRPSLIIYTSVLVYSGLLAMYFLFVNQATRFSRAQRVLKAEPGPAQIWQ